MTKQKETLSLEAAPEITSVHEADREEIKHLENLFAETFDGEECVVVGATSEGDPVVMFRDFDKNFPYSVEPFALVTRTGIDHEDMKAKTQSWFVPALKKGHGEYELPNLSETSLVIPAGSPENN